MRKKRERRESNRKRKLKQKVKLNSKVDFEIVAKRNSISNVERNKKFHDKTSW